MPIAITQPSYHHYQKLNHHISASLFAIAGAKRAMVTGSSSSSKAGAYTTIKERVTFEREIKKSKFIAIAGPISDEPSAFSFLSQVFILSSPFSPFPPIVNKRAISTFLKIIPLSG
jgi:hypothetical protein